ncbi:hypothetical protein [Companilactobacillus mishanensis]|uniref:YtxH domain-containing protein n=1 Tax=Companilactobacillus mishanensis TaxID=2486008 RepID=A0A5P0ZII7_9LACO|nr:hypothetical protein [Companilactobacillus mishanensis]MQS44775.1 hypothetical protein [Companilactobacillus mishanensis]MQS52889.1 hypothetical protein [Companilactobacillus mishanensis]MQS89290.1 hypothetical protein [Companilactobacillus mishanensis]
MKKRRFLVGVILGSVAGYFASRYLVSESGQKVLENIKTIRSDFNNGGMGLADKNNLINNFNEKTDALKDTMIDKAQKYADDEDTTDIVFDEKDIKNTDDKKD